MTTHHNDGTAPLVKHVYAASDDTRVRESMLIGALLEGGSWDGPWSTGDGGTSGGPFQIHWTVHPQVVSDAKAKGVSPNQLTNDPAYAVSFMAGEYKAAVDKVPAGLWSSNPELAAETAARLAERPAKDYYTTHGSKAVDAAWNTTRQQIGSPDPGLPGPSGVGSDSAVTPTTGTTGSSSGSDTSGSSSQPGVAHVKIPIPIPGIPDISFDVPWLRISLFIGGAALVLMGTKMLFAGGGPGSDAAEPEAKHVPVPVPV